jgi:hypothetical protein
MCTVNNRIRIRLTAVRIQNTRTRVLEEKARESTAEVKNTKIMINDTICSSGMDTNQ